MAGKIRLVILGIRLCRNKLNFLFSVYFGHNLTSLVQKRSDFSLHILKYNMHITHVMSNMVFDFVLLLKSHFIAASFSKTIRTFLVAMLGMCTNTVPDPNKVEDRFS